MVQALICVPTIAQPTDPPAGATSASHAGATAPPPVEREPHEDDIPSRPSAPAPEKPGLLASLPIAVTLGAARSGKDSAGARLALAVGDALSSGIFLSSKIDEGSKQDPSTLKRGWLLDLEPSIDLETGENDGFNRIIAKLSGNFISFPVDTTTIPDVPMVSNKGLTFVAPISGGVEADDQFRFATALVEIGFVPWLRTGGTFPPRHGQFELGVNPIIGVFLQGGRKFSIDDTQREGAAADESAEERDDEVLRGKLIVRGKLLILSDSARTGVSVGSGQDERVWFTPEATVWYDFINGEWYHKVSLVAEIKLRDKTTFEIRYDNGSGAPNFNQGSQFGVGLKLMF